MNLTQWSKGALLPFVPNSSTVLWLPGQDDYPSSTIRDRSGNINNGTIVGATWARLPSGLWVLSFDGNDDYINCGDGASLDITGSLALEAWVKIGALGVASQFVVGRDDNTNRNYWMDVNGNNKFNMVVRVGGVTGVVTSDTALTTTKFAHIVGTYDGSFLRCYKDGILDCTPVAQAGTIDNTNVSLTIGARKTLLDRDFTGFVGLVRIYNFAPSLPLFTQHFAQERHLFGV